MSEFKHAVTKDQKSERRQNILDAAKYLFTTSDYQDIKMIDIATMAEVSKGAVFLYFKTKEDLFIALTIQEFQNWYRKFQMILSDDQIRDFINTELLLKLLEKSLLTNKILLRLLALSNSISEKNLSYDQALDYKRTFYDCIRNLGEELDWLMKYFKNGDGSHFLVSCIALISGLYQPANPIPVISDIIYENEYDILQIDFKSKMLDILRLMLTGLEMQNKEQ